MTASQLMKTECFTLKPTDSVKSAIGIIMEHRYRNLPVVDEQGVFLGVFGVGQLLRLVLPPVVLMEQGLDNVGFIHESLHDLLKRIQEFENNPVEQYMRRDISTVTPNTPLIETLLLLYRTRLSIPVVSPGTGRLMGMISYFDVGEKILSA